MKVRPTLEPIHAGAGILQVRPPQKDSPMTNYVFSHKNWVGGPPRKYSRNLKIGHLAAPQVVEEDKHFPFDWPPALTMRWFRLPLLKRADTKSSPMRIDVEDEISSKSTPDLCWYQRY